MNWTKEELMGGKWDAKFSHGTFCNTFKSYQSEWVRREEQTYLRAIITDQIEAIFEPRFITPPETSEFIESLITMTDSRRILEIGMHSGFTTLHMLRAIVGKQGAHVTAIDARPAHNREFFARPEIAPWFRFVEGWTPQILASSEIPGPFDLIFLDSDHTLEHTKSEFEQLQALSAAGTIFVVHDLPAWASPVNQNPHPVRQWFLELVANGTLYGLVLPTAEQLDCRSLWGPGYPPQCNPHLGIFVRR